MSAHRQAIIKLLSSYAKGLYALEVLTPRIADAAFEMNHLYEDLGLPSRDHMNRLMQEHFPTLALLKPKSVRWKKFLFDSIEATAPACVACGDQIHCFSCELTKI